MNSKCCLVTGANGFLGSKLVQALQGSYSLIKGSIRKLDNDLQPHVEYVEVGTIDQKTDWHEALKNVDVVIHTAARVHSMSDDPINSLEEYRNTNTLGTLNLAKQALESGVKRFIFISSVKVNGESTYENMPFTSSDSRKPEDVYGQSKSDAEDLLLQLAEDTGLEVVIIRPTLVYGPGVKANFASLMGLVSKGIPLPFACITNNKRSLVSITNLVDLIATCIDHPKAVNQVFLASDDDDVSTASMVKNMSVALGKSSRMLPIPHCCFHVVGKLLKRQDVVARLLGSLHVDISHTKETLNWTPPQTLEEGFKETADAFLNNR